MVYSVRFTFAYVVFFLFFLSDILSFVSFDWWLLNVVSPWVVWMCKFFFEEVFPFFLVVVLVQGSFSFFSFSSEMSFRSVRVLVLVSSVRVGFFCSSSYSSSFF